MEVSSETASILKVQFITGLIKIVFNPLLVAREAK
jgi:hypothetical protein